MKKRKRDNSRKKVRIEFTFNCKFPLTEPGDLNEHDKYSKKRTSRGFFRELKELGFFNAEFLIKVVEVIIKTVF